MNLARTALALVFAAFVALAAGCPGSAPTPSTPPPDGQQAAFKVAFIHPGPTTDTGWNTSGLEGAELVQKTLGAQLEQVEEGREGKFEENLSDFARRGAKVVFAHGAEYQEPCAEVAKKFPGTVFVVSSSEKVSANQIPLVLRLDQSCYLAGILAGHLTKTKKVGAVGGKEYPPLKTAFDAFARGVKKANPEVQVVPAAWLGTWDDVAKGREQGLALLAAGADVIVHNADKAGLGVFTACREKGALAIGTNRNQNECEGGSVVAGSAVVDLPRAFLDVAKAVKDGKLESKPVILEMKTGYGDLVLNDRLKDRIPDAARAQIEEARKAILAGTLDPTKD